MLGIEVIYFENLDKGWAHFVVLSVGAETHFVSSHRARPGSVPRYCGVCIVDYSRALRQSVCFLLPCHPYISFIGTFETVLQGAPSHSTGVIRLPLSSLKTKAVLPVFYSNQTRAVA